MAEAIAIAADVRAPIPARWTAGRISDLPRRSWPWALAASAAVHAVLAAGLLASMPDSPQQPAETAAIEVVVVREEPSSALIEAAAPPVTAPPSPVADAVLSPPEPAAPPSSEPGPTGPEAQRADTVPPAPLPPLEPPTFAEAPAEPAASPAEELAIPKRPLEPEAPELALGPLLEPRLDPEPLPVFTTPASTTAPPRMAPAPSSPRPEAKTRQRPSAASEQRTARQAEPGRQPRAQVGQARSRAAEAGSAAGTGLSTTTYRNLVMAELNRRKAYPDQARAQGAQGRVVVSFTVGPAGRVVNLAVTTSSGHSALDAAARQAVSGMTLPPPPGGRFTSSAALRFRLDD